MGFEIKGVNKTASLNEEKAKRTSQEKWREAMAILLLCQCETLERVDARCSFKSSPNNASRTNSLLFKNALDPLE